MGESAEEERHQRGREALESTSVWPNGELILLSVGSVSKFLSFVAFGGMVLDEGGLRRKLKASRLTLGLWESGIT